MRRSGSGRPSSRLPWPRTCAGAGAARWAAVGTSMRRRYCRRIRRAAREGTAVEARSGTILLLAALIPLCHPAFAQGPSPPNQVQRIRRQYQTDLKVHGRWCYLYRAIDRNGNLVDVLFSEHRDMAAAQAFFRSAKTVTGVTPDRVTTDGHDSYPRAIRTPLGNRVRHRTSAYLNNRLEQDHRGIKGRHRPMRGFKCPRSAARFCRAYDELRNFLRSRSRHHQHVPADRRRLLHLRRSATVLAILQAA